MTRCIYRSLLVVLLVSAAIASVVPTTAFAQARRRRREFPTGEADALLKPKPRPRRPELSASEIPLKFIKGERIAFVGNSTAERMNLFGHFETLLLLRFPNKELEIRNFGWPADEVGLRQRPSDYKRLDDPMFAFGPDTIICFFGWNESQAGEGGIEKFKSDYENLLDHYAKTYPRDDAGSPPRFVLISPIAFEPTGDRYLPSGDAENARIKLYTAAVSEVAAKRKLAYVDLFTPTLALFTAQPGMQYTINGCHLNEAGDKATGVMLDKALFGTENPAGVNALNFEKLRAAVVDKSWVHLQDYRMVNGWYVYGGRRTFDTETFPREFIKIRNMVAVRDRYVWDIAAGKRVSQAPDDSQTGELYTPETRFGQVRYSEAPEGPRILSPDEFIKTCTVPDGFEVKLFADEKRFPELAKPVQLGFDNKGRLWVSTMPTYPMWKPGQPKPSDKLLILEDLDGDGKADKCTTFYDKLHCPTGFEFWNGGILVVDQPRMLFLKDTDGDDRADVVVHLIDGWATQDTHHVINAWEYGPGGLLYLLEGVSMSTTVETPWGPFRNFGSSGCYVLDPRTLKIRHFNTPGYGNPWCYVFNEWGQGFCGDGTGANQHWDTPLSGAQYMGRKGLNPVFPTESMRPVVGSEFLVSRHFPDDVQGQFIYACVINTNGMPRWVFSDDGGGYKGTRVRHNPNDPKTAFDLLKSTDKHFRPVDPHIGPDGALWFGDWANPLIGHMQYSQRDPNRDHKNGRIYRLVYKNKPTLTPVTQYKKSENEILEQFRIYEWRTRYTARAELRERPAEVVLSAVKGWVSKLDPGDKDFDRLCCEALWVQQGFHEVDPALLNKVLDAKTPDARAAAVRIAADEREYLSDVQKILIAAAGDENPRVRVEACRGLSFFPTSEAMAAVIKALLAGKDYWVEYTAEAALAANPTAWLQDHLRGNLAKNDPRTKAILDGIISQSKTGAQLVPYLQILLDREPQPAEARSKAIQAISDMKGGNAENGKQVFRRNCIACHRVMNEGADYGPRMDGDNPVGRRLTRYKIVESIVNPNADVDAKYMSTSIATSDGKTTTGLLVSETKDEVILFDGKEKKRIKTADIDERKTLKQSSMPDGLVGTLAPVEFLDLIAFLSGLR